MCHSGWPCAPIPVLMTKFGNFWECLNVAPAPVADGAFVVCFTQLVPQSTTRVWPRA